MFERYRQGSNRLLDVLAGSYNQLRDLAQAADRRGADCVDRMRRRRRKVERVDRLDLSLTETIKTLSEIEGEVAGTAARDLGDARSHLQWALTTIRS
jgi:hypothetical protein